MKSIDHLSEVIREIFPDSEIAKNIKLHRTKCTSIVKNVLGKEEIDNLTSELKNTKFSLLIDEGTDIAQTKLIACVVRYFSKVRHCVVTQLLEVISHDARDCSSEAVANAVRKCFEEKDIPLNNMIGMAVDNASVMVGEHNSVMTKLRQEADSSFTLLKCICHCMHIAASKAALKIPTNVEAFIRNISSYFGHSSKRQAQLSELQTFMNAEKQRILRPSDTRWLAMQHCIARILDQWEVLKLLFFQAQIEDRNLSAEHIMHEFNNPFTKGYLEFMRFVLGCFNTLNALFQSKKNLISVLQKESQRTARLLCQNFVKPEYLSKVSKTEPLNLDYLLPVSEVFLGIKCEDILKQENLKVDHVTDFRTRCLSSYKSALEEIKKGCH